MKCFRLILMVVLVLSSCKSKKLPIGSEISFVKKLSARRVSKKHHATIFNKKTLDAKLKVVYKTSKDDYNLSLKLRIEKDKVIWINAVYKSMVLVARAKITPTSVSYYEKINKTYFKGDFEMLENLLGTAVNFKQLQSMLLGEAIFDVKAQKYSAEIDDNAHLLHPIEQEPLFDVLFWFNPIHYKLDKQAIKNKLKDQDFSVSYKGYREIEGAVFPKRIEIRAQEKENFTEIDLHYRSVIFNKKISTPFKIPRGYKQVTL